MRYFLGLVALLAFIVLVVVVVTHHGSKNNVPARKNPVAADYVDKNSMVRLTTDGEINAEELHRSTAITVTPDSRSLIIYKGYNQEVLNQYNYSNEKAAYASFLKAISLLGYTSERKNAKPAEEVGVCPLGSRYIYELESDNKNISRLWSTTCTKSQGTFAGSAATTITLFQAQIPDYSKLTSNVQL